MRPENEVLRNVLLVVLGNILFLRIGSLEFRANPLRMLKKSLFHGVIGGLSVIYCQESEKIRCTYYK